MRKNTKAILVFLCALVMVLTGIGMPKAYAAATVDDLTVDYVLDSLGDAVNYGIVAKTWHQEKHAESNACVDILDKVDIGNGFANSSNTYAHITVSSVAASITSPNSLAGMTFALYKETSTGYALCTGTEQTVESGNTAELTWNLDSALYNQQLHVFLKSGDGYVPDNGVSQGLVINYGPAVFVGAANGNYLGKILLDQGYDTGKEINVFNTTEYFPSIVLGPETDLYVLDSTNKPVPLDWEAEPSAEAKAVYVNYFYPDPADKTKELMGHVKLNGLYYKNGQFMKNTDTNSGIVHISKIDANKPGYAATLVDNSKTLSTQLANMGGGTIDPAKGTTPNSTGSSTVTGPVDGNGKIVSVYDVEVGEDWLLRWSDDLGVAALPVADNEYVIVNVICPSSGVNGAGERTNILKMGTDSGDLNYFIEGKEGKVQCGWGNSAESGDRNASQRVIYNIVYADENGILQPYEGTIYPHSCHGGTILAPEAYLETDKEVHNGAMIVEEVRNDSQELHGRMLAQKERSTWVVMGGGYLTLEKASIGYDNRWHDMSKDVDLSGAVFGVYSDEDCSEDSLVSTITTDAEGKATSDLISAGTYWVKEITPLKDHNLAEDVIEVTVAAGEPTKVVHDSLQGVTIKDKFINQQNNGSVAIRVLKEDDFGNPLQGAVFGIYKTPVYASSYPFNPVDCKDLIGTAQTNRNGVAVFDNVPLGYNPSTYYIKEITAPDGYQRSGYVATVNLPSGRDEANRDKIYTADGAGNNFTNDDPFVNTTIRGNMALKKVDAADETIVLPGAEFTVYSDRACTKVVGVMKTGDNGIATSEGLDKGKDLLPGTYYVVETKVPDGYKAPTDKLNNGQERAKVYTVTVQYGETVDVLTGKVLENGAEPTAITNEQVVSITGVKYWYDDGFQNTRNNLSADQLAVNLYKKTATGLSDVIASCKITKEDVCPFEFKDLPRFDANGEEIEYVVKEFLGHGNVPYYSFVTPVVDEDTGNIHVTIANSVKKTKITVKKAWEFAYPQNAPMPSSITYLLFQKLGEDIVPMLDANGNQMSSVGGRYNNNYEGKFENLPSYNRLGEEAQYVIKEAESDDFALIGEPDIKENVHNQSENEYEYTLTNRLTVPLKGTKTWVDSSNADGKRPGDITLEIKQNNKPFPLTGPAALDDVEIVWDKETDTDVWSWKIIGLPKYDADGNEYSYTVSEVHVPGYKTTVSDDGLNFTNTKTGDLELYKVNSFGAELQGAEFKLYYDAACQNPVPDQEKATNPSGHAEFKDLTPGDYYLKEEAAPFGYELMSPNPLKVTVVAGKTVRVNGENGVIVDNWYGASIEVTLPVTKELKTAHYMTRVPEDFSATFEFAIEADEETAKVTGWDILKDKTAVTVMGKETVTTPDEDAFSIKFTQAGTYTFEVKETTPGTGYIKADDSVYTVTYTVAVGKHGRLHAEASIYKNEADADSVHFVNTYGYVDIVGDKVWKDADNSLRLRIDEGTFKKDYLKLYIDGEENPITDEQIENWGAEFQLTYDEDGYWDFKTDETYDTYSWAYENLPAYDEKGEMITYVVKEMTVKGYQTFYVNGGYNAAEDKKDGIYADAVPPSSPSPNVIYNTLSKGTLTINKTVDAQDNAQPETLPEFQFTITPATGLTGYHFVDAEGKELTSPVTVAVEKNADGTISGALPVTILFDNFTEAEKEFAFTVAEVKPDSIPAGWTYDATAQTVTFTVTRNANDYTVTVSPDEAEADFTNAYKKTFEGSVSFYVNKKLDGKSSTVPFSFELLQRMEDEKLEQLAVQENSTISDDPNANLPAGVAAFNLAYDDDDLGKTYEYVIRELKKDGYTHDTAEYKYKVVISENGEITRYYWDSETADYEEGNSHALFSNKTLTSVTVYKYWPNSEPQDVSAYLFLCTLDADGTLTKLDPQPTESKTDNDDSSQTYTWSDLSKFDAAGNEITYAVIEEGLEGYAPEYPEGRNYAKNEETIVNNVIRDNFYIYKQVPDTDEINTASLSFDFTITPGVADGFTLSAHDVDDLEPKLLTPDGEGLYTVSLGAGNQMNFDVVFTKAGTYTFTVEEKFDEVPDGWVYDEHAYIVTFEVGEDGSVKKLEKDDLDCHFTNEYHGTTGLTVCKEWVGAAASDIPVKPENFDQFLTLRYAAYPLDEDGNIDDDYEFTEDDWTVYEDDYGFEVTVYEDEPNKWYVEYANLPNAIEGKEVTWSVVEDPIDGFTTKYTDDKQWAESWETITNSSVLTSASINKVWLHESFESADKVPNIADKLTLCKLVDGVPVPVENAPTPVYIPDTENSGMYTWDGLPMFENGKEIEYVVIEQKMDGYEQTYFDSDGCIIENGTYAPHGGGIDNAKVEEEIETTNVSITKVWVGGPLVDSDISDNLVLFADGVAQTDKPTKTDNVYAWYDLPKYEEDGELITYSVKEDDVADGYTVTYQDEDGEDAVDAAFDGGMITNTYEEKIYESKGEVAFEGIKIFDGHIMEGGEFTFILTDKSGKELQRVTNAEDGSFAFDPIKYTEKDVPYGTDAEFTYYITELEGNLPGVTYDDAKYEITVGLWDDTDGTIHVGDISDSADGIIFTNTYKAEGSVTFQGAKFLLGREFKAGDEFTFELLNDKGDVIDTVTINPTSGTKADFAFKTIKYDLDDVGKNYTYTYRVKEKAGTEDGMIYDDTVHTVTVTVSDAGDGTLKVVASDAAKHLNFTNTYLAEGAVIFSGTKTMEGKELVGNDFTFVLTDADGKVIETVTNDKDGKIVFSTIEYELEDAGKTFTYKVSEKNDGKKAVTYDETVYTVTVKVEDAGSGHLKVTASDNATKLNFKNSYEAKAVLTMNAYKTVNGYKPSVDQVYDFVLQGNDGTEMKAQNKAETITFGTIAFDEEDIGKTFIYTVKETTEANELLDVDAAIYQVKVTVADNGDGNLKLETEILKDGKRANGVVFANTATATLAISKNVKGPGPDKAFDLKVTFIGVDGKELEGVYDYDGDVKGTITSGGVIALKDGQSVTIVGLPEGATYTVEENAGPAYTVTVNGKPIAKAEGTLVGHGKLEFINTVEVTTFSVTKVWEGMDLGEITLTLYADGKQITPQPEVTREGNKYTYYNLPKYNEEGEEIVYSAKERGIDGYIRIYNNVEPYQDVTSVVHDGGTIVNRETHEEVHELSFKIHKVWTGVEATEEIPAITLTLYCNGEKLDVPTPKPDSEGWYRYYDLPKSVNGKIAVYTVIEEPIAGYTVTYKTAGGEIVEEGVNGGEIINAKIPQTGDHATLGLWLAMMGASAVLLTMLQRRRKA